MEYIFIGSLIIIDIISGLLKGGYTKTLDSSVLRRGLYHKLSEILSLVISKLVMSGKNYIGIEIDFPLYKGVYLYICICELISIIENLCVINPQLNHLFGKYLTKMKGGNNEK